MKRTHICFITDYYGKPHNGPGTFALNFVELLSNDKSIEITVISGEADKKIFNEKLYKYKKDKFRFSSVSNAYKIRRKIVEINKINKIDKLYFNCYRTAIFSTNLKIPYVVNINDHHSFLKKNSFWEIIGKKILRQSQFSLCNSFFTKNMAIESTQIHENKFIVTLKGVELNKYSYIYNKIEKKVNILFVGSDYYRKGLDILLESLGLLNKNNVSFNLDIVGEDKNVKKYMEIANSNDIFHYVNFLGKKSPDDIASLHNKSHIFILPSREEALGVSIIEAMISGTSIIASNVGGIPTLIEDNFTGLLFTRGDSYQLFEKIMLLYSDESFRRNLSLNAKEKSLQFSRDRIIDNIKKILISN
jgi:glycosyltransferase involved in cell wall biosynthesis